MNDQERAALRNVLEGNPDLQARFAEAQTEADIVALAREAGVAVTPADGALSDAELESVSGGYTFPQTDWVYCDNPWTNSWCTLKC